MVTAIPGGKPFLVSKRTHRSSRQCQCKNYQLSKTSDTSLDGDAYVKIQATANGDQDQTKTPLIKMLKASSKSSSGGIESTIAGPRYSQAGPDNSTDSWVLEELPARSTNIEEENLIPTAFSGLDPSKECWLRRLPSLPAPSSLHMSTFLEHHSLFSATGRQDTDTLSCETLPASVRISSPKFSIPIIRHPNSPYVPWSPDERGKILCTPCTPNVSSYHSLRSSLQARRWSAAHIAREYQHLRHKNKFPGISRSLRNLTFTAQRNVKRLGAMLSLVDKPGSRAIAVNPKSFPNLPRLGSVSVHSEDSSETASLAAWLAARQEANEVSLAQLETGIGLEEYDYNGSWQDSPRLSEDIRNQLESYILQSPSGNCNIISEGSPGWELKMPGGWVSAL